MDKLNALISQQDDKIEIIVKGFTNFKKSPKDRLTNAFLETKLEQIEKEWECFRKTHQIIIATVKKEERNSINYFKEEVYAKFEDTFIEYKTRIKTELQKKFTCTSSKEIQGEQSNTLKQYNSSCDVKLPRIQLPTFTGNYEEWQSFHDMFHSVIHNNENLSAVQKLHYLKSSLSGEPETLLRNLPITEANYNEAWNQLNNRYNNKRYISNTILKRLLSQKHIHIESTHAIKQMLDTTSSCLNSLNNIGVVTENWDIIIIYLITSKLDNESRKQWETHLSGNQVNNLPNIKEFFTFLENRFRILEMVENNNPTNKPLSSTKGKTFHSTLQGVNSSKCITCSLCANSHYLFQCKRFINEYTPEGRSEFVQSKNLCFNCLAPSHAVRQCHQKTSCRKCNKRHHTLLHYEKPNQQMSSTNGESQNQSIYSEPETNISTNFASEKYTRETVVLATTMVKSQSRNGNHYILRALMDQGSQASLVTESTVQLLGLKRIPVNGTVSGVDNNEIKIKHMVQLSLQSIYDPKSIVMVKAFILKSLTSFIPPNEIVKNDWKSIKDLDLADPSYGTPRKVDLLLGAEIYSEVLQEGLFKEANKGGLVAQKTLFGWIISGRVRKTPNQQYNLISGHLQLEENEILKRFWQMECEPDILGKKMSKQETLCEELYEQTTTRDTNGRYVVKLPLTSESPECLDGQSRNIAMKRYELLEKRLRRNYDIYEEYQNVLKEYVALNHMSLITDQKELNDNQAVYLPHHAVIREDKETTKVRVVFDASCKGVNGVSLNDNLMIGPKLQQDLRHILMRWRENPICISSDIVKMYRMVRVMEEDTRFQKILWRPNPHEPIQDFKLLTLTFGTACAPYLAVKTLQRLADDEGVNFPRAAEITQRDFYVDDLMTGCESNEEAIQIFNEMTELMNSGGFKLQKWSSNNDVLLKHIYKNNICETDQISLIKNDDSVKVLGVQWNRITDSFGYTIKLPEFDRIITKRKVLSTIARLYDPIGWIAPVIVTAKIFIQKLWKAGIPWDEELSEKMSSEWTKFKSELLQLKNIQIPRWIGTNKSTYHKELHAFADASKRAFAAVVYLRSINENGIININLITAKTKVTPIEKEVSIPRLELCAALLASKLLSEVSQVMGIEKKNLYAWSDSMVVLAWLKGSPDRWTTFVSNRVSQILTILDIDQWNYIKTSENPADCASRGVQSINELKQLWWKGPDLLSKMSLQQNQFEFTTHEDERKIKTFVVIDQPKIQVWDRFSDLSRLVRVISYCRRFLMRKPKTEQLDKCITVKESNESLLICIKQLQNERFHEEIKLLKKGNNVTKKSILYTLHPIIDKDGLVRVGGRINSAHVNYCKKHPLIIPPNSHLTSLIIRDAHIKTLHGGTQLMLNLLRANYWIIKGRNQVKQCCRKCITCIKHSKFNHTPIMGQLPEVRLTPSRPFKSSGVDFAGPVNIKFSPGRGSKVYKGYICLFVCMVTRAVHLEAVSDLSTKGFIAAFRRFVSRRGHCQNLYSDNGTNFVGANKELEEMFKTAVNSLPKEIAKSLSLENTNWHFNPPYAPNFGGLWEAGIKSTKFHLKRIIGNNNLTFEELATVLTQIEACLNSRPLTELNDDPLDPLPLTPAHFLIGEPIINLVEEDITEQKITTMDRWRLLRKIVGHFWKRWSKEYLVALNRKLKWIRKTPEPELEDVVVVQDDHLPPSKWLLGRVLEKHTGKDGITRVVTIKCKNGILKRPVSKIIIFPRK